MGKRGRKITDDDVQPWSFEGGRDCELLEAIYLQWKRELRGPPGKARRLAQAQLRAVTEQPHPEDLPQRIARTVGVEAEDVIEALQKGENDDDNEV